MKLLISKESLKQIINEVILANRSFRALMVNSSSFSTDYFGFSLILYLFSIF